MGKMKKKGESGQCAAYYTRNQAVKKLGLTLTQFKRLCIVKGIFPREPAHRIRVQKGDSTLKLLYAKRDIRFLLAEPLLWTMRAEAVYKRKVKTAIGKKDSAQLYTLHKNKPYCKLDKVVMERYPTFIDAIAELSDPLTMVFLFAVLPRMRMIEKHMVKQCQTLKTQFLTYIIETKCLRKAFISTKGYYYEVEIMGKKVVWTTPHSGVTMIPAHVDMTIMIYFLEVYVTLLGFVNFRLYQKANLRFPPKPAVKLNKEGREKKDRDFYDEHLSSLNIDIVKNNDEADDETKIDSHLLKDVGGPTQKAYEKNIASERKQQLFKGLRFYIGRENNKESLTLVIRACSGEVSWDSMYPGNKYSVDDQSITHEIVDRPVVDKKYLSRYYVQPQWVYDSLNCSTLLPVQQYFPGVELPPHVCPFIKDLDVWYIAPEEQKMRMLLEAKNFETENPHEPIVIPQDLEQDEDMEAEDPTKTEVKESNELKEVQAENIVSSDKTQEPIPNKRSEVARGKPSIRKGRVKAAEKRQEHKMRVMMMHKKNRFLYKKLRASETRYAHKSEKLRDKRIHIEKQKKLQKFTVKKSLGA